MARSFNIPDMPPVVQGLLFGVLLGLMQAILGIAASLATGSYLVIGSLGFSLINIILNSLSIVLTLVTLFLVAWSAARLTGKASTGRVVSTCAALFSSLIYAWSMLISTIIRIDTIRMSSQEIIDELNLDIRETNAQIIIAMVIFGLIVILVTILIGLIIGTIGGRAGQSHAASRL